MAHLVIDGYNYINRSRNSSGGETSLDTLRRSVLERFFQYKKVKGGKITVVFDAHKGFSLTRQGENYKGINVVYSKENETADDVIIEWIRQRRAGMVVVTSDRMIIDEAKAHGVPFLTPVKLAEMMAVPSTVFDKGEEDDCGPSHGMKKGNPRKLPKRLRKVVKYIHKLT